MHSAIGMWIVPFFLLMCFTGLDWSYDWYRSAMFTVMQVETTKRATPTNTSSSKGQKKRKTQEIKKESKNLKTARINIYENAQK